MGTKPRYTEPGTAEFAMEAVLRQQNQVSIAVMTGPIYTMGQLHGGAEMQQVLGTQVAAAIEVWLVHQALSYSAGFVEQHVAKSVAKKAIIGATPVGPAVVIGAGSAIMADKYVSTMEGLAPEDPAQKASFMNSIAAAMGGTFGGINLG